MVGGVCLGGPLSAPMPKFGEALLPPVSLPVDCPFVLQKRKEAMAMETVPSTARAAKEAGRKGAVIALDFAVEGKTGLKVHTSAAIPPTSQLPAMKGVLRAYGHLSRCM